MERWECLNENGMYDVSFDVELKPCPFCGGRPYITEKHYYDYYILCSHCFSNMPIMDLGTAIRDWNRRAHET